jgi:arsenite methyltransferase
VQTGSRSKRRLPVFLFDDHFTISAPFFYADFTDGCETMQQSCRISQIQPDALSAAIAKDRAHKERMDDHRFDPNEHKRRIATIYNLAAAGYDQPAGRFFQRIAQRLVELAQPKCGDMVLDAATGTGAAALCAASKVTPTGRVIGVDLAGAMLAQAHQKVVAAGWSHVELVADDMEQLQFDDDTFDVVLCSSGIFLLPDMLAGLREWRRVLKPGGTVAFSGYSDQAFQPLSNLFETYLRRYGVPLAAPVRPFAWQRLTELEQYSDLLRNAGFATLDVRSEQQGYYLTSGEEWWEILWHSGFREPLTQLAPDALARFKTEHLSTVASLATGRGIWLNVGAIFAVGHKG